MRPTTAPLYWFARGNGVLHTGVTEVGLETITGLSEFEFGTNEIVALKLDKYKAELPEVSTKDAEDTKVEKPTFYRKDGKVTCIKALAVKPIETEPIEIKKL